MRGEFNGAVHLHFLRIGPGVRYLTKGNYKMTTTIENKKIFLDGIFGDATINVAGSTTLEVGTVLGVNESGKIVPFESTTCDVASYVLGAKVVNTSSSAADFANVRVFECGQVSQEKLIFKKSGDETNANVLAGLKSSGIIPVLVHEETQANVL